MSDRGYGVDLGGTAIKAGAVASGLVLDRDERETPHEFEACMDAIAAAVRTKFDCTAPVIRTTVAPSALAAPR